MNISIDVTWQDLAFIWCLIIWIWFISLAMGQQSILPINFGLTFIYSVSLIASIPGVPAYLIWKYKKRKNKGN